MGQSDPEQSDNRRQKGRLHCEYFYCRDEQGKPCVVLDLSNTGMKMCQKGKLRYEINDDLKLTLRWSETEVQVEVRVRWVRTIGFRMHMLGLEFINMTSARTTAIQGISRMARKSLIYD